MSYSYIKSVFPNFENSNVVYDKNLYIAESSGLSEKKNILPDMIENDLLDFSKTLPRNNQIILPQEKLIEKYRNIEPFVGESVNNEYAEIKPVRHVNQNNLKYYNIETPIETPIDATLLNKDLQQKENNKQNVKEKHFLEKFESNGNCDSNTKHIFECNKCKMIIMKQFGIEADRVRNEEIMELISYILFGLFILMLIDYIKNNK